VYINNNSEFFIMDRVNTRLGATISGEINTVIERYQAILDKTELPKFTKSEIRIMSKEFIDVAAGPATTIDQVAEEIRGRFTDGMTGEISATASNLCAKLEGLNYTQKVVLLERMLARQ
jgi:hypothetical protein